MFPLLEGGICSCIGSVPSMEHITPDDEDVLQEEIIIKEQRKEGVGDPNIVVQICSLVKTYPGTTNISCCKCKKTSPYHAIKVLNLFYQGISSTISHHYGGFNYLISDN